MEREREEKYKKLVKQIAEYSMAIGRINCQLDEEVAKDVPNLVVIGELIRDRIGTRSGLDKAKIEFEYIVKQMQSER